MNRGRRLRVCSFAAMLAVAIPVAAQDKPSPRPAVPGPDAGAALSQMLTPGDPAKVAAAFKAICLDHPADADAQAKTATAPEWGFKAEARSMQVGRVFTAWPMQLVVAMTKTQGACLITSTVADTVDRAGAARTIGTALGLGEPTIAAKRETEVDWTYGEKRYPVRLDVRKSAGLSIVTLGVETEGVW